MTVGNDDQHRRISAANELTLRWIIAQELWNKTIRLDGLTKVIAKAHGNAFHPIRVRAKQFLCVLNADDLHVGEGRLPLCNFFGRIEHRIAGGNHQTNCRHLFWLVGHDVNCSISGVQIVKHSEAFDQQISGRT